MSWVFFNFLFCLCLWPCMWSLNLISWSDLHCRSLSFPGFTQASLKSFPPFHLWALLLPAFLPLGSHGFEITHVAVLPVRNACWNMCRWNHAMSGICFKELWYKWDVCMKQEQLRINNYLMGILGAQGFITLFSCVFEISHNEWLNNKNIFFINQARGDVSHMCLKLFFCGRFFGHLLPVTIVDKQV